MPSMPHASPSPIPSHCAAFASGGWVMLLFLVPTGVCIVNSYLTWSRLPPPGGVSSRLPPRHLVCPRHRPPHRPGIGWLVGKLVALMSLATPMMQAHRSRPSSFSVSFDAPRLRHLHILDSPRPLNEHRKFRHLHDHAHCTRHRTPPSLPPASPSNKGPSSKHRRTPSRTSMPCVRPAASSSTPSAPAPPLPSSPPLLPRSASDITHRNLPSTTPTAPTLNPNIRPVIDAFEKTSTPRSTPSSPSCQKPFPHCAAHSRTTRDASSPALPRPRPSAPTPTP